MLLPHRWPGDALHATLIERPNRFLVRCKLGGRVVEAHVPDRGRCLDLLVPGQPLVLVRAQGPLRRTRYTALLARACTPPSPWVSLDPAGAPRLVERALEAGLLRALRGLVAIRREVRVEGSRIDLLLGPRPGRAGPRWARAAVLCEVKSVGAASGDVALFPDAPTLRGARHLALLAARARAGEPCAVVLCAQRGDVRAIAADARIDPQFAAALAGARAAGVRVCGLVCDARPEGMAILSEAPILE